MPYSVSFTYDVEDEFDDMPIVETVREDKEFDDWDDVILYSDELRSCPWISNVSVIDNTID